MSKTSNPINNVKGSETKHRYFSTQWVYVLETFLHVLNRVFFFLNRRPCHFVVSVFDSAKRLEPWIPSTPLIWILFFKLEFEQQDSIFNDCHQHWKLDTTNPNLDETEAPGAGGIDRCVQIGCDQIECHQHSHSSRNLNNNVFTF